MSNLESGWAAKGVEADVDGIIPPPELAIVTSSLDTRSIGGKLTASPMFCMCCVNKPRSSCKYRFVAFVESQSLFFFSPWESPVSRPENNHCRAVPL